MMEYFRLGLIKLRTFDNNKITKNYLRGGLVLTILISTILGLVIDKFLPFNFLVNGLRGILANLAGFSIFASGYLISTEVKDRKIAKDKFYNPLRKRFSYRQRVNLSLAIGSFVAILVLLSSQPTVGYTLKASLAILAVVSLVAFSRKDRDEFLRDAYEMPDLRDSRVKKKDSE